MRKRFKPKNGHKYSQEIYLRARIHLLSIACHRACASVCAERACVFVHWRMTTRRSARNRLWPKCHASINQSPHSKMFRKSHALRLPLQQKITYAWSAALEKRRHVAYCAAVRFLAAHYTIYTHSYFAIHVMKCAVLCLSSCSSHSFATHTYWMCALACKSNGKFLKRSRISAKQNVLRTSLSDGS